MTRNFKNKDRELKDMIETLQDEENKKAEDANSDHQGCNI